jgi:hypothetical protein
MAEVAEASVDIATEEVVVDNEEDEVEEDIAVAPEEEDEEEFVAISGATEIKLFGKWAFDDIEVRDISLVVRHHTTTTLIGTRWWMCFSLTLLEQPFGIYGRRCHIKYG